jgi:hypothetical protein
MDFSEVSSETSEIALFPNCRVQWGVIQGDLAKLVQMAELEASIEQDIKPKKPQKPEETPVNGLKLPFSYRNQPQQLRPVR